MRRPSATMYRTPAVVTTSKSSIVYMVTSLLLFSCSISESLLQLRALVTRIDQPKVLQHLRLAIGLDLGQVDRKWRVVLFVHLNGPARPLEDDRRQDLDDGIRVRGASLFNGHRIRVQPVVLLLGKCVWCLQLRSELLLHRLEEAFVLGIVDACEIIPRVVHALGRVTACLRSQLIDGEAPDRHREPGCFQLLEKVYVGAAARRGVDDTVGIRRSDLANDCR